jgi:hypothetical protein
VAPPAAISFNYPPSTFGTENNALAQISFLYPLDRTATEADAVVRVGPSYDYPAP